MKLYIGCLWKLKLIYKNNYIIAFIKVGYKQVDIGVAGIICTPER